MNCLERLIARRGSDAAIGGLLILMWVLGLAAFVVLSAFASPADAAFNASGRFLYADKLWDKDGYTGQEQNLPVRHARVEILDIPTLQVIGSGATDNNGNWSVTVTPLLPIVPVNIVARVLTDGRTAGYEIRVVDELERGLGEPAVVGNIHAVLTDPVLNHNQSQPRAFGTYLLQDTDGTGVAQAFNIFDNAVDFFDWMAQPSLLGRRPNAGEYIVYAWSPIGTNEGSNYSGHAILLSSPGQGNDTDAWSDTVILHETGHWFDDFFSRSDNPGGAHSLGDNNANVKLAYGEGVATFHCSKVRKLRATTRTNLVGQPVDRHVSIYGDLTIPPDSMMAGGLSFSYDFETGVAFQPGLPPGGFFLGQRGSANETNVTSAQWDLVDDASTPDETPGIDDDQVGVSDAVCFNIEHNWLPGLPASNVVTIEDYYQGWYAQNGANYLRAGVDDIFLNLSLMEFYADGYEPDGTPAQATAITPLAYTVTPGAHLVISELDLGAQDAVEVFNPSDAAVNMTGWTIQVYVNDDTAPVVSRVYVFPPFTLDPGEAVAVLERGDPLNNGAHHLYGGSTVPNSWNASWNFGLDGACVLNNASQQAVDFVTWRAANGTPNSTPVPSGTAFTGVLDSPAAPFNLARDINGTDTDAATDWTAREGTLASANGSFSRHQTLFDVGDADLIRFDAVAGQRYGFEVRAFYSASDPYVELISPTGTVVGSNDNVDPGITDARIDLFAGSTGTYYLKVRHVGPNTDWAAYNVAAFQRPPSDVLLAPGGITATAANTNNSGDPVHLEWLNGAVYDNVKLYRNGTLLATLPGDVDAYDDAADRGVYTYEVSGVRGLTETARVSTNEFAGLVGCFVSEDFEEGAAPDWVSEANTWGVTPLAEGGVYGYTDSPVGTSRGCHGVLENCSMSTATVLRVPVILPPGSRLLFDHICITEHCEPVPCDFGAVEISTDEGQNWTELARYDQASDPGWADNAADPTDWRPADISLNAYTGQTVLVRFRVQTDPLTELDGWYLDNVRINEGDCTIAAVPPAGGIRTELMAPYPNPMTGTARFAFRLAEPAPDVSMSIYDLSGRLVRREALGALDAGDHLWQWNGQSDSGEGTANGVYFARLETAGQLFTRKVLKVTR
ncbi:MAG TPA: lamin tail domain-containing protein [Candidatus Eisenbacteria bacterium]